VIRAASRDVKGARAEVGVGQQGVWMLGQSEKEVMALRLFAAAPKSRTSSSIRGFPSGRRVLSQSRSGDAAIKAINIIPRHFR
jgi:hypothetical protein